MFKNLLLVGTVGIALSGCAQLQSAIDFIDAPATQQAVFTLQTVSKAIICDISAGSALAKSVEVQVNAHTGITNTIYTVSTAVCQSTLLGGTAVGTTTAPVAAVATVAP